MSKKYAIDEPVSLEDIDGDLVYHSGPVTDEDRELVRADDEVVNALNNSKKHKNVKKKKQVKFGGRNEYRYQRLSEQNSKRPEPIFASYDDDSDSDIEIDLEAKPGRRRLRNKNFRRKFHFFLFLVLLLGGLLFLANVLQSDGNSTKDHSATSKRTISNGTHDYHPTTVLVSLDGFHPHYIDQKLTPNLHEMFTKKSGVPYMTPSFPSSTFPNHWTLITGLYPANHGIVGNTFYDIKEERQFVNTNPEKSLKLFWWGGEPIWQTLDTANIKTAVHMWPGSEAPWEFDKLLDVDHFNSTERLDKKIDRVFHWLDQDIVDRPELVLTYVPTIDQIGHKFGITGEDLKEALQDVDGFVGSLKDGLKKRNLDEIVNLIIVSDHGMAPTSNERVIFIDDLIDTNEIEHMDGWPLFGLRPKKDADLQNIHDTLKAQQNESFTVYKSDEFPPDWHFGSEYKYKSRIAPLWVVPSIGWAVTTHKDFKEKMNYHYRPRGVHGYNNTETLMRATFLAQGPYFNKNEMYEPIANVDVYNIICDTLGAQPAKNDGRKPLEALKRLDEFHDPQSYPGVDFDIEIMKINSTYDTLFDTEHVNKDHKDSWKDWFDEWRDHAASSFNDFEHWVDEQIH